MCPQTEAGHTAGADKNKTQKHQQAASAWVQLDREGLRLVDTVIVPVNSLL